MNSLKLVVILLIFYFIVSASLLAFGKTPCAKEDQTIKLIEMSQRLKLEAGRAYLRLDWNGTSVTQEQYDRLMRTNQDHYTEDPNLRMVNP